MNIKLSSNEPLNVQKGNGDVKDLTGAYFKPSGGIPASDLATAVQDKLVWETNGGEDAHLYSCYSPGESSVAEGSGTVAGGYCSHAEGAADVEEGIEASGYGSHAGGFADGEPGALIESSGPGSFVHGAVDCRDDGAEAYLIASGKGSHAEGNVNGEEGANAKIEASGDGSHAEGYVEYGETTLSSGYGSHAEGRATTASGGASHAEGLHTIAQNTAEHAGGRYNYSRTSQVYGNTIFSVGIGANEGTRKNAIEITDNGSVYVYGVGGFNGYYLDSSTVRANLSAVLYNCYQNASVETLDIDDLRNMGVSDLEDTLLAYSQHYFYEDNFTSYCVNWSHAGIKTYRQTFCDLHSPLLSMIREINNILDEGSAGYSILSIDGLYLSDDSQYSIIQNYYDYMRGVACVKMETYDICYMYLYFEIDDR